MINDFNIQIILDAVKEAGDSFLKDYKKNTIPSDKAELFVQLNAIEIRVLNMLKRTLTAEFSAVPWGGDEFNSDEQRKPLDLPVYWLCDSMDGAIQFLQHLPGWTINLVLVQDGVPSFAAIYDPLSQEMFRATVGGGAFMNNTQIKPSSKTDSDVMVAIFEYGHQDPPLPGMNKRHGAALTKLLDKFGVVRNYGPHGLQLAYIGAGRIDVFHQLGLDTYNWLAGILIAREAGADILTSDGDPWNWGDNSLLVSAPGLAERLTPSN